ncbi:hypothetical protein BN2476_380017 [Paraburkholderia piptadeniae]|uniref:Uncharacterized protein n=1 Tax=Paraburkholderia piptadeniae TaxID=1701573 RepID=A0A1N7S9L8_9BURK|nr:hypothetical protein BN2476_380017 [Paraburkholderia piptadeniae]
MTLDFLARLGWRFKQRLTEPPLTSRSAGGILFSEADHINYGLYSNCNYSNYILFAGRVLM